MSLRVTVLFLLAFAAALVFPAAAQVPAAQPAASTAGVVSREQLLTELTGQLTQRYQLRGELQLELLRPWAEPASGAAPAEVVIVTSPSRLSSSLLIQVRLVSGGRTLAEQTLSLKAQVFRDAFVSRTPQEREALFDPVQFDLRRVDVLRERDVVAAGDCEGDYTFATSVGAGRLLTWRDLTRRALVRKGQLIEVAAVDGAMTITTQALAMENGAAGDSIRVRNVTSKKDFTACVVAEARAQVRF